MSIGKRLLGLAKANLTDFRLAFDRDHLREMLSRTVVQNVKIMAVGQRMVSQPKKEGDDA